MFRVNERVSGGWPSDRKRGMGSVKKNPSPLRFLLLWLATILATSLYNRNISPSQLLLYPPEPHSGTMSMEIAWHSETSVHTYYTTYCNNTEDCNFKLLSVYKRKESFFGHLKFNHSTEHLFRKIKNTQVSFQNYTSRHFSPFRQPRSWTFAGYSINRFFHRAKQHNSHSAHYCTTDNRDNSQKGRAPRVCVLRISTKTEVDTWTEY
jgi:hypothetical protein